MSDRLDVETAPEGAVSRLPVVELRSDQFQASTRHRVGLSLARADRPLAFELPEGLEIEAGKQPAFTGDKLDFRDLSVVVTDQLDPAALGVQVQNALFGA